MSKFFQKNISQAELSQPNADQGASEKRTEPYVEYGEGASQRSNTEMRRMGKFRQGFTLVETLVAIFILSMAITSAMTVAQGALQASFYSRDRISAYFLASEAIEMIKNKRDENGIKNFDQPLAGVHWLDGIALWATISGPCGDDANLCGVDVEREIIESCAIDSGPNDMNDCELFKSQDGIIGHENGLNAEKIKFTRTINMENIGSNEAKITVNITWPGRTFTISEHIFNWHPLSTLIP